MRVAFFGTPDFAVPSLRALVGEGFEVCAVVTQPDRAQGRSRSTLVPPPVKVAALAEGLTVLQPESPDDGAFLVRLRGEAPDVGVVVAYGHILEPELLELPRRGMVNVHPSLLPELRGAAPIQWTILNGLPRTGITIMLMDAGLDTGPILHQIAHEVPAEVTGGELTTHLAELGAQALVEGLTLWEQGAITPKPQDDARATSAPKITRETARLDWSRPADRLVRAIRALDPKPGAWCALDDLELKLFTARVTDGHGAAGVVLRANGSLLIAAGQGAVEVFEVQPAGKARMTTDDWQRGRGVEVGRRFT
ncbi:MAG: methionyl-tRNA formyltransferase [Gemmatimonadales bacterium]